MKYRPPPRCRWAASSDPRAAAHPAIPRDAPRQGPETTPPPSRWLWSPPSSHAEVGLPSCRVDTETTTTRASRLDATMSMAYSLTMQCKARCSGRAATHNRGWHPGSSNASANSFPPRSLARSVQAMGKSLASSYTAHASKFEEVVAAGPSGRGGGGLVRRHSLSHRVLQLVWVQKY